MQAVIETPMYRASAKRVGLDGDEGDAIVDFVARNPKAGVIIPGTGGARKLRWRMTGKGKSGGYRVITWWGGGGAPVLLLDIYSKAEKADLTAAERQTIKALLGKG